MTVNVLYFDFTNTTFPNIEEEFDLTGFVFSTFDPNVGLTHSPADILRWALIGLGLGLTPSTTPWPIYASSEPDIPDNCITTYDSIGNDDGRLMIDGSLQQHQGVQIRIRSVDHATGWRRAALARSMLAQQIYDTLVTINSSSYIIHSINRISNILALGKEIPTSKRSIFVINAVISVKQIA